MKDGQQTLNRKSTAIIKARLPAMSTKYPLNGSIGFCFISLYLRIKRKKKKGKRWGKDSGEEGLKRAETFKIIYIRRAHFPGFVFSCQLAHVQALVRCPLSFLHKQLFLTACSCFV
jgi:hypothetical protein